jgi:hypothetical protein
LANLEADHSIIYMLGRDLRIVYCNKAWDEFASLNGGVGLNRKSVLGKSVVDVIAEPLRPFFANGFAQGKCGVRGGSLNYSCRLFSAGFRNLLSVTPVTAGNGGQEKIKKGT